MPAYVAFLRAVNLGRNRRFPMAELRACLAEAGYADVRTHLATGNVLLTSERGTAAGLEARLEETFAARTGFAVPTVVLTPEELVAVHAAAVAAVPDVARRYVTLLKAPAPAEAVGLLDAWDAPGEGARVLGDPGTVPGRAVAWWIDHPNQDARLSNARIERHAGPATTRDLKVVAALAARWGAGAGPEV